jgi:cell division protein FtsW
MRPRRSAYAPRQRPAAPQDGLQLGRKHRPDYWLLIWCAVLLSIGLIVVYAISPALAAAHNVSNMHYVGRQLLAIALSIVAFVITARVPLQWWRQAAQPLLIIAAIATLLALVLPVDPAYPAHRWVRLGSFSFQSVELLKFAGLLWLAGFLAARVKAGTITSTNLTLKPLLFALLGVGLVVAGIQSDLGSMGVIVAMMGTMAFVAGLPMGRIALIAGVVLIGVILAVSSTPYRRERLQAYLHPEAHCQTSGYQACQALIAVGSGGFIGLGLGSSVQAYGYLPEAANDSIFAIYAEKFGFVGSIILIGVMVALFSRLKTIAERSPDDFSRLLVVGILAWLSVQTLVNVGAMLGLLPLKGITLPFVSYGGTSVVFVAAAIGLVFQVSQYTSFTAPRASDPVEASRRGQAAGSRRITTVRRASY